MKTPAIHIGHCARGPSTRLHALKEGDDAALCGGTWLRPTTFIGVSLFLADKRDGCKVCQAAAKKLVNSKSVATYSMGAGT